MTRFVFRVPHCDHFLEPDHTEVPDLVAARRDAIVYAATMLNERPSLLGLDDTLQVQVHDGDDRCLLIVNVQVIEVVSGG